RRSALSLAATENSRSASARVRSANESRSGFIRRAPWVMVSAAAAGSRPWVGPGVRRLEAAPRDVRVDLGGGEVAVAEQLLDRSQVGAPVEEVAREAMAERVGVRRGARAQAAQDRRHVTLERPCRHAAAPRTQQERLAGLRLPPQRGPVAMQ